MHTSQHNGACHEESYLQFVGCGGLNSATNEAAVQTGGGRRRQVIVAGKRVKTIDVHAHCVIPKALELMGKDHLKERGPGLGDVGLRRIGEMDEQGIDVEAISINPHWYHLERDLATEVVKINNETLADQCHRQSAGYHDRAVAPDLRGHAGKVPRPQGVLSAWWGLCRLLRGAFGQWPARSTRNGQRYQTA